MGNILPMSFRFPSGDTEGGQAWQTPNPDPNAGPTDPYTPDEKLFYHAGTVFPAGGGKPEKDGQTVYVSFQVVQRAGTILKFTPVEAKGNKKNNEDKRDAT